MAIQVPSVSGPRVQSLALPAPQVRPERVDTGGLDLASAGLKAAQQIAQKSADDADTAAVIQAESQLSDWKLNTMFAPETGVYNRKGQQALDITNQTLPQFDQEAERLSAGLTNERQRARFQQIAGNQRQSLNGELNRYEFGERNQYYDDVDKASLTSARNGALAYYQDPQQVAYYQSKGARVIAAQGQRKGLPPELVGLETTKYISGVATEVIGRMAVDDPMKAQQYYASAYQTMTPEDQLKVSQSLGTSIRKQWGSQIGSMAYGAGSGGNDALPTLIIQAESNGNAAAISPKGARGLMQLMPDTAKEMAAELGVPYDEARLTADPNYNTTLGTAYLNKLLGRYGGNSTLAVAAYNAGPGSVDKWLKENGDPRTGEVTEAQWIERIPFGETKAYTGKIINQLQPTGAKSQYAAASQWISRNINDPELARLAQAKADDLYKADQLTAQANYEQAANLVYDGGIDAVPAQLLDSLPAEDRVKLDTLDQNRRKGTEPTTDYAKLEEFLSMPPEQLGRLSLERDLRPVLNNADFKTVSGIWRKIQQGDESENGQGAARVEENALKEAMAVAGIKVGTSKDAQTPENLRLQQQFRAAYQGRKDAIFAATGQQPTAKDAQEIASQLLLDIKLKGAGIFGSESTVPLWQVAPELFQGKDSAFIDKGDLEIGEIPPAERLRIVQALRSSGQAASDENIIGAYIEGLTQQGISVR